MRVAFVDKADPFLGEGLLNLDGRAVIDATSRFKAYQRVLADAREIDASLLRGASPQALALLRDWCEDGWIHTTTRKIRT